MTCRADAGDAHRGLVGIGLEIRDQPPEVVGRQALFAGHQKRLAANQDDRLEVLLSLDGDAAREANWIENLEERVDGGDAIDPVVLEALREAST